MKVVYNLENFVVNEMFKPFQNIIVKNNEPKNIKKCECIFRKNPEAIILVLENNKKAYNYVFNRLSRINFKFYKWLKHPLVDYVNLGVITYRMASCKK